ncbi:MAG: class I SAM-dependent methyltransferase [Thiohalospira sp.]
MFSCPLCLNKERFEKIKGVDKNDYQYCPSCKLIFSLPDNFLTTDEEKERYLHHNNGIQYSGYVHFLNQAVEPALGYLKPGMECLDFGCGPVPTLSILIKRNGFGCDDYDPLFFPELPDKKYDVVFATECFEHFYHPAKEIKTITSILKKEGFLIMMTQLWKGLERFHLWHYTNDDTHVVFYHKDTIRYIAEKFEMEIKQIIDNRVIILQKTD